MAKLLTTPYPGPWLSQDRLSLESINDEISALKKLQGQSDALPPGEVVGKLLAFPVADGCAYYVVVRESPLTVQWVPALDSWHADAILIRGLKKSDIARRQKAKA